MEVVKMEVMEETLTRNCRRICANGTEELEKLLALEKGLDNNTQSWVPVGAGQYRRLASGVVLNEQGQVSIGPSGKDFDLRPEWPLLLFVCWTRILIGLNLIIFAATARFFNRMLAARKLAGFCLLVTTCLLHCASAIGWVAAGSYDAAVAPALYALTWGAQCVLLITSPRLEGRGILALAVLTWAVGWAVECPVLDNCRSGSVPVGQSYGTFLLLGVLALPFTWGPALSAVADTYQDSQRHARVWASRVAGRHIAGLLRLRALASAVAGSHPASSAVRHLSAAPAPPSFHTAQDRAARSGSGCGSSNPVAAPRFVVPGDQPRPAARFNGSARRLSGSSRRFSSSAGWSTLPVKSMSQLYCQAAAAAGFLSSFGQSWAAAGDGTLSTMRGPQGLESGTAGASEGRELKVPVGSTEEVEAEGQMCTLRGPTRVESGSRADETRSRTNELSPASSAIHSGGSPSEPPSALEELVGSGILKHPRRTAIKAIVCYDGDVSRVVDVCRLRVWFATVEGMARGLEAISADSRVAVVRIKDMMRDGLDEWETGGFRGIVLNLCLRCPDALSMGLENHVCEVQLVLDAFDYIVDPSLHRRYLQFRDARGSLAPGFLLRAAFAGWICRRQSILPAGDVEPDPPAVQQSSHPACSLEVPGLTRAERSAASLAPSGPDRILVGGADTDATMAALVQVVVVAPSSARDLELHDPGYSDGVINSPGPPTTHATPPLPSEPTERGEQGACDGGAGGERKSLPEFNGISSPNPRDYPSNAKLRDGGPDTRGRGAEAIEDPLRAALQRPEMVPVVDVYRSKAVTVSSTKVMFQCSSLIVSALCILRCVLNFIFLLRRGAFDLAPGPNAFRFTVVGLRNGAMPVNMCNNFSFGLAREGRPLPPTLGGVPARAIGNGSSPAVLTLPFAVEANGYYFTIAGGDEAADPVRWVMEVCAGANCSWSVAGGSAWRSNALIMQLTSNIAYRTPQARGVPVIIDHRQSWADGVMDIALTISPAVGFFLHALMGRLGRPSLAASALTMCFGLDAVLYLAAMVSYIQLGRWFEIIVAASGAFGSSMMAVMLKCAEKVILQGFLIFGIVILYSQVLRVILWDLPLSSTWFTLVLHSGTITFCFMSWVLAVRQRALWSARQLVLANQAQYDEAWTGVMSDLAQRVAVQDLMTQVCELLESTSTCGRVCRQFNRRRCSRRPSIPVGRMDANPPHPGHRAAQGSLWSLEEAWDRALQCGVPGTLDFARPATDIDQLYLQALVLHPVLIRKVQAWAEASDGWFQVSEARARSSSSLGPVSTLEGTPRAKQPAATFVKWGGAMRSSDADSIKWANLKSPSRAAQKATRQYGQDFSRVTDFCRQSIYFDSVQDLTCCLRVITSDPDVAVVRVKNRLDPQYDSAESAGFRNVLVNLRVVTEATMDLGVETHVCEVQLMLKSMASIKNEEGHRKYISFRNLRGE